MKNIFLKIIFILVLIFGICASVNADENIRIYNQDEEVRIRQRGQNGSFTYYLTRNQKEMICHDMRQRRRYLKRDI